LLTNKKYQADSARLSNDRGLDVVAPALHSFRDRAVTSPYLSTSLQGSRLVTFLDDDEPGSVGSRKTIVKKFENVSETGNVGSKRRDHVSRCVVCAQTLLKF
jgi:hypothetical protein